MRPLNGTAWEDENAECVCGENAPSPRCVQGICLERQGQDQPAANPNPNANG